MATAVLGDLRPVVTTTVILIKAAFRGESGHGDAIFRSGDYRILEGVLGRAARQGVVQET